MMKLISYAEANPAAWFELDSGIRIMMTALNQWQTYQGLLVGLPTPKINDARLEDAVQTAAAKFGKEPAPYLIAPLPLNYTTATQGVKISRDGQRTPSGQIEETTGVRLPFVTCIAKLRCPLTLKEPEDAGMFAYSTATLVWFQDSFAMPISVEVDAAIRALRWERVAEDVSD